MIRLTEAQQTALCKTGNARVVTQLHTGAVVAVFDRHYQVVRVIDINGRVFSFNRYLAIIDRRSNGMFNDRLSTRPLPPLSAVGQGQDSSPG